MYNIVLRIQIILWEKDLQSTMMRLEKYYLQSENEQETYIKYLLIIYSKHTVSRPLNEMDYIHDISTFFTKAII